MSDRGKLKKSSVLPKNGEISKKKEIETRSRGKVSTQENSRAANKSVEKSVGKSRTDKSVERSKNAVRSESLTRNKPIINNVAPKPIKNKQESKPVSNRPTQKELITNSNKSKTNSISQNLSKTKSSGNKVATNNVSKILPKRNLDVTAGPSKPISSKSPVKYNDLTAQMKKSPKQTLVKEIRKETANLRNGRTPHSTESLVAPSIERPRTGKVRSGGRRGAAGDPKAEAIYIPIDLNDEIVENTIILAEPEPPEVDDYEDDFEDYESDFESDSENSKDNEDSSDDNEDDIEDEESEENDDQIPEPPKLIEINRPKTSTLRKPTNAETAPHVSIPKVEEINIKSQVSSRQNNQPTGILKSSSSQFFNFAKAEKDLKNQTKLTKAQTRSSQLLDLITLDKQIFGVYDSPPVNYEVFIQIFGQTDRKQVYVETDPKDEESIQTDIIEVLDKWTQMPANGQVAVGGQKMIEKKKLDSETNWLKMNKFLNNSSQLIREILDEEASEILQSKLNKDSETSSFSQGFLPLKTPNFLSNSLVVEVIFSSNRSNYLMTSHNLLNELIEFDLRGKSFICVWNLKNILEPEYILATEGSISKMTLNPGTPSLIFSGLVDGSVSMWSLRESTMTHVKHKITLKNGEKVSFLIPTFCTSSIQNDTGHQSRITALQAVVYGSSANEDSLFCHLLTLEEFGTINTWSVVPTNHRDQSGLSTDLGMRPGGNLKLVKTATINLTDVYGLGNFEGLRTYSLQVFPQDPSQILVTTDLGMVYHFTRHGGMVTPRFYKEENLIFPFKISSLSFNPHYPFLFATGCDDGIIRIFKERAQYPVLKCILSDRSLEILTVAWSSTHPTHLFSLDNSSSFNIWDISKPNKKPIAQHSFKPDILTTFCLHSASKEETVWSHHVAISLKKEGVIIHKLKDSLNIIEDAEYKENMEYLDEL